MASGGQGAIPSALECPICYEIFEDPVTLPCGHSICRGCLNKFNIRDHVICPFCRAKVDNVQSLGINITLKTLVEIHQTGTSATTEMQNCCSGTQECGSVTQECGSSKLRCPLCSQLRTLVQCGHCEKLLCSICRERHEVLEQTRKKTEKPQQEMGRGYEVYDKEPNDPLSDGCKGDEKDLRFLKNKLGFWQKAQGQTAITKEIAIAHEDIGRYYMKQGNFANALHSFNECLKIRQILDQTKPETVAKILCIIGKCHRAQGDVKGALSCFDEVLTLLKRFYGDQTNHPMIATSFSKKAACYTVIGQNQKALEINYKALEMRREIFGNGNHPDIAISLNNIGNCYYNLKEYEIAMSYYKESLAMNRKVYGRDSYHVEIKGTKGNIAKCQLKIEQQITNNTM